MPIAMSESGPVSLRGPVDSPGTWAAKWSRSISGLRDRRCLGEERGGEGGDDGDGWRASL